MWLQLGGPASVSTVEDGSPVDRFVYSILLLLAIIILARRQKRLQRLLRGQAPILLFVGYCLVSIVWSDFPTVAFKRWIKLLTDVLMVFVVVTDPHPVSAVKRFLARSVFVLVILSVLFIKYYPHLGRLYDDWTGAVQYSGVGYNKNSLGGLCLFLGSGYLWLLLESVNNEHKRLMVLLPTFILLAAILWLLTLSHSATSFACFLMGATLIVWTRIRFVQRRPILFHFPAIGMIAISAGVLFFNLSSFAFEVLGKDSTLTDRTNLWDDLLKMAKDPILGTGYESFWLGDRLEYIWSIYWWRPNQAHNGYIELYINLGWIGVALFTTILAVAYIQIARAIRSGDSYASLRLAWIVIAVVYNFTEASFRMQNRAWVYTLFAAVGVPWLLRRPSSEMWSEPATKRCLQSRLGTPGEPTT